MLACVETIDRLQPSVLAIEAASLFISEITQFEEWDPNRFLAQCMLGGYCLYTLSETDSGLIAASLVEHNETSTLPGGTRTFVHAMAVERSSRKRGMCKLMMRHLALRAIECNDHVMALIPEDDGAAVFPKLGFGYHRSRVVMEAIPETVLAR